MIRYLLAVAIALAALCPRTQAADVALYGDSVVSFATVDQGAAVLTARDEFVTTLSPFDRAARLKSGGDVDEKTYLAHVAKQVRPWSEQEVADLTAAIATVRQKLAPLSLHLPKRVMLIKTTGLEEGGAAYTRGQAIVLSQDMVDQPAPAVQRLLIHELFHVMSRHDAKRRDALYAMIGFKRSNVIEYPPSLKARRITNPDAPLNEHVLHVAHDGQKIAVVPILYASKPRYDAKAGGDFFDYLTFRLLVVHKEGDKWRASQADGQPVLLDPRGVPDFLEQIGRNTGYIIHPEEVLAENFVLLVMGKNDVPTPRVLDAMRRVLATKGTKDTKDTKKE